MSNNEKSDTVYSQYFTIIQVVINRMAQNTFLIKAWTITLITAILVLTFSIVNSLIFGVLLAITVIFWVLDSYYLKLERIYRRLYKTKVEEYNDNQKRKSMKLFDMDYEPYKILEQKLPRIMISKTEILFYLPVVGALICFLIISIILMIQ
ncbi:hypothetical protein LCGC14_1955290 [marine sediment metagenome]|uniref:Uncharacterized protein n=1 Tax=marine sediment metagenome TaxID=412755 RepID=A0A0F9G4M4_9ZZZZ